jgi:DnaJ domain
MAQHEGEIANLVHAYRVLDVPWDASPRAIKASYRKLVKRWHPDRYRPGTGSHTESTLMTRLLNESYARIEDAPLRNGTATPSSGGTSPRAERSASTEPDPSGSSRSEYIPRDPMHDATEFYRMMEHAREAGARDDAARPFDSVGFIVRFVLGALFGALLSFRVMITLWRAYPSLIPAAIVATILFCAFASGFGGDAFWRAIRPYGPWWWRRWD